MQSILNLGVDMIVGLQSVGRWPTLPMEAFSFRRNRDVLRDHPAVLVLVRGQRTILFPLPKVRPKERPEAARFHSEVLDSPASFRRHPLDQGLHHRLAGSRIATFDKITGTIF